MSLTSYSTASRGQLTVIADVGGTSVENYIPSDILEKASMENRLNKMNELMAESKELVAKGHDPKSLRDEAINSLFPLRSYSLKEVTLVADILKPDPRVTNPIAFIGYQKFSIEWMDANYDYLVSTASTVILVEARNPDDVVRIKKRYPKLRITPQNGTYYQSEFGLPGYPVLITNQGIYQ